MTNYPLTPIGEPADDPYRWLEGSGPEVASFVHAQNAYAEPILTALPGRQRFFETVTALVNAPVRGCPWVRFVSEPKHQGFDIDSTSASVHDASATRFFAWHNNGANQDVLVSADSLAGLDAEDAQILLDPNEFSLDGTVAVTAATVNPEGNLLAYALADGGSDWTTIKVRDIETGKDFPETIKWTKWNLLTWLPGGRSFSYWAYDPPTDSALIDKQGAGRLMSHTVATPVAEDTVLFARPDQPRLFAAHETRDEDWFVLSTRPGSSSGNDLRVRRWTKEEPHIGTSETGDEMQWRQLVDDYEHHWQPIGVHNQVLLAVTNHNAPRYRLVGFNLISREAIPICDQHPTDVLLDARLTSSGLVLQYSSDASHRLQLASFDGELGDHIPLGSGLSIDAIQTSSESDQVYVTTTSFVDRGTRHVVILEGNRVLEHQLLPVPGPVTPAVKTERIRAISADGTPVPAFLVRLEAAAGPCPTLIWAYGGFNIPMNPEFRPVLAAWVAAGGVLCVPNLRGGGEFGTEWHQEGTKERKQNVFNDLFAVAEYLIAAGVTTSSQLALHGRSNGGLLAGAALTQRPDLWAAVLPTVGVLDMLRYHKFTIGWAWASDYGDPEEGMACKYLKAYSPLHNVRPGTEYPPTLIMTGDHDDRVVPAHSYKFTAALQAAQGGSAPIVLSVDTRAGHGSGKPRAARALEYSNQLAFAAHFTGLKP